MGIVTLHPLPREPTFRLVVINQDGTRVVLGTRLTELQANAVVNMLAQGTVTTQIIVEPEQPA